MIRVRSSPSPAGMTCGERVRLRPPGREHVAELAVLAGRQPRAEDRRAAGRHLQHAVRRALGARLRGVGRRAVQHVVVDRDLRVRPVALVLAEQPFPVGSEPERIGHDRVAVERERRLLRPVPTTCCGTTASAARGASPRRGRGCATVIADQQVVGRRPWRTRRRRRSSGPRRTRRYRAARTPTSPRRAAVGRRPGRRRGTPPAGTCTGTSCTSASAWSRGRSSTPSRPRRGCPRCW